MGGIDIRLIKAKPVPDLLNQTPDPVTNGFWEFLNKEITFRSGPSDKFRETFYLELGILLDAGVNIRAALELIRDNQAKKTTREIVDMILQRLISGASLASSLESTNCFSNYEHLSVQIGEETGKLNHILKELAVYFQKKIKQRRQIIGALTYPAIVLGIALTAIIFMVSYVVPMFSDVFKRFGGDLPYPTRIVLYISKIVRQYLPIYIAFVVLLTLFIRSKRNSARFRAFSSSLILKLPVVNTLVSGIYLSRFANTMSLLISAKIPMLQGITMCRKIIGFYPIEQALFEVERLVMTGTALNEALGKYGVFPKKMISMIRVGEDVNQMELFFSRISDQYSGEVEYQTGLLSKAMEPIIIILLGVVVGAILIAMYLPLFKLGQGF